MGGACSIGCMGGRISSEELDENVEMKNQNSDISINNNLKRRKSFGNLKKKKNKNSLDDPISASPQRFYSGELGISADLKVFFLFWVFFKLIVLEIVGKF